MTRFLQNLFRSWFSLIWQDCLKYQHKWPLIWMYALLWIISKQLPPWVVEKLAWVKLFPIVNYQGKTGHRHLFAFRKPRPFNGWVICLFSALVSDSIFSDTDSNFNSWRELHQPIFFHPDILIFFHPDIPIFFIRVFSYFSSEYSHIFHPSIPIFFLRVFPPDVLCVVTVLPLSVLALPQPLRHHPLTVQLVQNHHAEKYKRKSMGQYISSAGTEPPCWKV